MAEKSDKRSASYYLMFYESDADDAGTTAQMELKNISRFYYFFFIIKMQERVTSIRHNSLKK